MFCVVSGDQRGTERCVWLQLGLSTKLMLGLERGLPTVTTPHGTTGYNITDWGGNQGVLVAEHTAPAQFAAAMAMLVSTESRWTIVRVLLSTL